MVPASWWASVYCQSGGSANAFNSIPKLVCIVQQSTLIPAGLPLGSAEDANTVKGDNDEILG